MGAPAPLLAVPGRSAPDGGAAEWIEGAGGVRLRLAWFPAASPRGAVILSAGRAEPIEKYFEVVDELRGRGFSVVAHDWRGQGLSGRLSRDPLKGHGQGWAAYLDDFRRVLAAVEARAPRPWIGLGHSMGGALTALALAEGERRLAAAVLSAPMMGVNLGGTPAPVARTLAAGFVRAGRGEAYVAGPGDPLGGRFEDNILTHDRGRWERTRALLEAHPPLQLGGVTWGWLDFALSLCARLGRAGAGDIQVPVTVACAGDEALVDNAPARLFAARTGAESVTVEGAFHEILMETDPRRAAFWAAFDAVAARV